MDFRQKREETTVIHWKPVSEPPEDGSYVLIQCLDESGNVVCEPVAYEQERFFYFYGGYDDAFGEVSGEIILGWSYYPFDERNG